MFTPVLEDEASEQKLIFLLLSFRNYRYIRIKIFTKTDYYFYCQARPSTDKILDYPGLGLNHSTLLANEQELRKDTASGLSSGLPQLGLGSSIKKRGRTKRMILKVDEQICVQILLVDDHALMRRGMKGQFALEPGFSVVGEANDGAQAIELAAQLEPDVVLMDIDLPVIDGIAATQQIKSDRAGTRILALSAFDDDTQVMGMLAAGADGYCLKTIKWEQLIAVIKLIQVGGAYLDPQIAQKLARMLKPTVVTPEVPASGASEVPLLSNREREVLKLIASGCSNQEIAEQLYLSLGTVKSYVRMLLNKLSVDDRVQAAAMAVRKGLI